MVPFATARWIAAACWVGLAAACGPRMTEGTPGPAGGGSGSPSGSAASRSGSAPGGRAIEWLVWHDIQALEGGRALYVASDGRAIARVVEPEPEVRARGTLPPERLRELERTLHEVDVLHMTVPDRPGVPDEARAILLVRFASGEERRVEKWDGVAHAGFDAINALMRTLTSELVRDGTTERVPFDPAWHPAGPWPNPFAR